MTSPYYCQPCSRGHHKPWCGMCGRPGININQVAPTQPPTQLPQYPAPYAPQYQPPYHGYQPYTPPPNPYVQGNPYTYPTAPQPPAEDPPLAVYLKALADAEVARVNAAVEQEVARQIQEKQAKPQNINMNRGSTQQGLLNRSPRGPPTRPPFPNSRSVRTVADWKVHCKSLKEYPGECYCFIHHVLDHMEGSRVCHDFPFVRYKSCLSTLMIDFGTEPNNVQDYVQNPRNPKLGLKTQLCDIKLLYDETV